jgi:transcriptional regulator with XRE-family HTH domain
MNTNEFGNFFKELRLKKQLSLRKFCLKAGADPGNISKMERGVLTPPGDEILKRYASALDISEGDNEWFNLFDLAAIAKEKIPSDIAHNEKTTQLLPVFFRTLRNQHLDEEKMLKLAEKIKEAGL